MKCVEKPIKVNKQMAIELEKSINIEEEKLCYLKYFVNNDYYFTDNDIYNIKRINTKEKFFFIEESNNNIGENLLNNNSQLDKILPTYILFNNKRKNKKKWKKIKKIITRNDLSSRNSIKIFKDLEEFNEYKNNYVYSNKFQKENINITIYGDSIIHKTIYKKLKIKYDFYYINLEHYEQIKTKITFLKNKQLMELLGAEIILIDRQHLSKTINSHIIGLTNYNINENLETTNENQNAEKNLDLYKYKVRKGFYTTVKDFFDKVDNDKFILLSREEIEQDFELKSLIGARIEKSLKEFNKVIYVSKRTNKELKIELLLKQSYGISFTKKQKNEHLNFLKIKAIFYGVEKLYCLDEIPLTYEGFKILNDIVDVNEKKKYIENFYIRVLRKNNYLSKHIEKIESNHEIHGNDYYKKLSENISSYFNIEQLLETLRGPNDVALNSDGFDILRICAINREPDIYRNYKENFLKRVIKLNNIDIEQFIEFLNQIKQITLKKFIETKLKSFCTIKKYIINYLSNTNYCSLDEKGFYFFFFYNSTKNNNEKRTLLKKFITRYIENNENFNSSESVIIHNFIDNLNQIKIDIIYELDYFSFKNLLNFIVNKIDYQIIPSIDRIISTPIRAINTPINTRDNTTNEILCVYDFNS